MVSVNESPEIWHRDDFGTLATWRCYKRVVEVGVDRAEFACTFLRRWINSEIYLGVDPYAGYKEMPFVRDADFHLATNRLTEFGRVARLVRATSAEVAGEISRSFGQFYWTRPYDMVYIDGAHDHDSVFRDCHLWWDIIRDGGMLAGHDWHDKGCNDNQGVQAAVLKFASRLPSAKIFFTWDDNPSSWYIYKNADPIPGFRRP